MAEFTFEALYRRVVRFGRRQTETLSFSSLMTWVMRIGCYGAPDAKTPRIDRLAAEGVKYLNAYAMGAECTPSRTAILTVRYPARTKGMECAIGTGNVGRYDDAIALAEKNQLGLPATKAMLAPALKTVGYRNAIFGKWHPGYEKQFSPLEQGFDEFTVSDSGVANSS